MSFKKLKDSEFIAASSAKFRKINLRKNEDY